MGSQDFKGFCVFQQEFFNHLDEEKDLDSPEEQTQEAADKTKLLLRYV